jgi:WD40 repeat protein
MKSTMYSLTQFPLVTAIVMWSVCLVVHAEEAKPITYDDHVATIFKKHCLQCHVDSKQEAGLNLANYLSIRKGGSGGEVVVAGRSSSSRLFKAITDEDPEARMPPKNDPLPKEQIALIKSWIDTGLRQTSSSSPVATRTLGFTPTAVVKSDGPSPMPGPLPVVEPVKLNRPFPVLALAASPRALLLAVTSYERIDFVDPLTRNVIGSVPFPEGEPHVLRFSRSGSVLLAAGGRPVQNGVAVLFDVKTGKRLAEIGEETDVVIAADLSADERHIAIGGSGRVVKVYSTETGSLVHSLVKHTEWITAIAYSPDGKLLATADRVGNIHLWDGVSGGVVLPLAEHKASVTSLAWRSDSQVLASTGACVFKSRRSPAATAARRFWEDCKRSTRCFVRSWRRTHHQWS